MFQVGEELLRCVELRGHKCRNLEGRMRAGRWAIECWVVVDNTLGIIGTSRELSFRVRSQNTSRFSRSHDGDSVDITVYT